MSDAWNRLGEVSPGQLVDTTLQLHWAVQYLASAGQTFVEPRDDDSHRSMLWDAGRRSFVGEPFAGAYPFRLALRPADLTMHLLDQTGGELGSLPLGGHTREQGYEWLAAGLANYMGAPPEIGRPEYDMPEHPVSSGAPFADDRGDELAVLSALYGSAHAVLAEIAEGRDDADPVRCWPHHFDLATLITLQRADGDEPARTVGMGLAPMGGGFDTWYWYVSPYPFPSADALPELAGPGRWHTEGWVGTVLEGEGVVEAEAAFRGAVVRKFLDTSFAASRAALGV